MSTSNPHGEKGVLETKVDEITSNLQNFIDSQLLTSVLLFVSILVAIILSNVTTFKIFYNSFINTSFGLHLNGYIFHTNLKHLVTDFLLSIFFLILGLEIKREFVVGELSELSKSLYIVLCSLGAAFLPVGIYLFFNFSNPATAHGWAIPMATDTALAIGLLYLFKNRIPKKLFPMVASMAVLDDILSVIVVAIFYTSFFSLTYFLLAIVIFMSLIIVNLGGLRHPLIYTFLGFLLWICIEKAGIHGTIAGILLAMCIPARPKKAPKKAINNMRNLINRFENEYDRNKHLLEEQKPHQILEGVKEVSLDATTPLKRWENKLELPVLGFILPLFALTNGGFQLHLSELKNILYDSLFWGIFIALVFGKPMGMLLTSWLIQKLNIAMPPNGIKHRDIVLIAFLSGIGYTMSIFISELSFDHDATSNIAKLSIFISSVFAVFLVSLIMASRSRLKA